MKRIMLLVISIVNIFINGGNNILYGTIINYDKTSIKLYLSNSTIIDVDYLNNDFNVGDYVEIKYEGSLDYTKDIQDIKISSINTSVSKNDDTKILNLLKSMTLEEKIGQLIVARVPANKKIETINDYHLGGYLLFRRDVVDKTKDELKEYIKNFQDNSNIPMIIAIDEEGGEVSRLSLNSMIVPTPFLSAQSLYDLGGFDAIREDAINKVNLLTELGINVNLAPVADVTTNKEAYMYKRSFGKDAKETSVFVKTVLESQTKDVSYVLKHFPGYGDNGDTHKGSSVDNRSYESLKNNDFIPFKEGIKNGAMGVLVSHNIVDSIDNIPASLSLKMHNILRNDLNFNGVIITDDLSMGAISDNDSCYVNAILAGNNLLIATDYKKAFNDIMNALKDGVITEKYIDKLVYKVLEFKENKDLI